MKLMPFVATAIIFFGASTSARVTSDYCNYAAFDTPVAKYIWDINIGGRLSDISKNMSSNLQRGDVYEKSYYGDFQNIIRNQEQHSPLKLNFDPNLQAYIAYSIAGHDSSNTLYIVNAMIMHQIFDAKGTEVGGEVCIFVKQLSILPLGTKRPYAASPNIPKIKKMTAAQAAAYDKRLAIQNKKDAAEQKITDAIEAKAQIKEALIYNQHNLYEPYLTMKYLYGAFKKENAGDLIAKTEMELKTYIEKNLTFVNNNIPDEYAHECDANPNATAKRIQFNAIAAYLRNTSNSAQLTFNLLPSEDGRYASSGFLEAYNKYKSLVKLFPNNNIMLDEHDKKFIMPAMSVLDSMKAQIVERVQMQTALNRSWNHNSKLSYDSLIKMAHQLRLDDYHEHPDDINNTNNKDYNYEFRQTCDWTLPNEQ